MNGIKAVMFDAVGTLIRPHPPVAVAYQLAGREFGSRRTLAEIDGRFLEAWRSDVRPQTSEAYERERWRRVVAHVFDDVEDPGRQSALFETLWGHFADARNWRLDDDVLELWRSCRHAGVTVGIASNFDSRLVDICRHLEPLSRCEHIFCSSRLGFSKPDVGFFRGIEAQLGLKPQHLLLVGDDLTNDIAGAAAAGWQSLHVPRQSDRIESLVESFNRRFVGNH